jgi:hypothetical protein
MYINMRKVCNFIYLNVGYVKLTIITRVFAIGDSTDLSFLCTYKLTHF